MIFDLGKHAERLEYRLRHAGLSSGNRNLEGNSEARSREELEMTGQGRIQAREGQECAGCDLAPTFGHLAWGMMGPRRRGVQECGFKDRVCRVPASFFFLCSLTRAVYLRSLLLSTASLHALLLLNSLSGKDFLFALTI